MMLAIASADWPGVLAGIAAIMTVAVIAWGVWSVRGKLTAISAEAGPLKMSAQMIAEVHEQITDPNGGTTARGALEEIKAAVSAISANHDRLRGEMLRGFASSVEDRRNIHAEIGDIKHRVTRIERHLHLEGDQL